MLVFTLIVSHLVVGSFAFHLGVVFTKNLIQKRLEKLQEEGMKKNGKSYL